MWIISRDIEKCGGDLSAHDMKIHPAVFFYCIWKNL